MKVEEFDFIEYHNQSIDYDNLQGCYGVVVYNSNDFYFEGFKTIHLFKHKLECFNFAFKLLHRRPFDFCRIKECNEVVLF